MHKHLISITLSCAVLAALSGCQPKAQPTTALPLTAQQQTLFSQSCQLCHGNPSSAAPQTGDVKAWAPRLEQGMPTLVEHALMGFNAMPAGGMCVTCTASDMEAMINHMTTPIAAPTH